MTKLLRDNKLTQIDRLNLAEEIEDMGQSEKRPLESNFEVVLMHFLKCKSINQNAALIVGWQLFEHRK